MPGFDPPARAAAEAPACGRGGPDDAQVGPRLAQVIRAATKNLPIDDIPGREQDVLRLLRALRHAYADAAFQAEIGRLSREAAGNEISYLNALGPAAAKQQAPVFTRFGLPLGQRGVVHLKLAVKAISGLCPHVTDVAGDLRELLGLPREEPGINAALKEADQHLSDLSAKIARAPLDVRGPLAEALRLPYRARPEDIAREVPKIKRIAEELAAKSMHRPREEITGDGTLLGPELRHGTDAEVRAGLVASFERYLNKMLARVITSLESFTKPPEAYRCAWADCVVRARHAAQLWAPRPAPAPAPAAGPATGADGGCPLECGADGGWLSLGVGVTVADGVVDPDLALRARRELAALEAAGEVHPSTDACNVGARSVWLHFESDEERQRVPPALLQICLQLAGLPAALLDRAAGCSPPIAGVPNLRVHPHVMAATYRKGAEYHCHKDSYEGKDNQRMVSVLLYLNHEWRPGDGGELRVFGTAPGRAGADAAGADFVDIAPLCGRLVMFNSREVWHAVREPREQRWALTLWVMAD